VNAVTFNGSNGDILPQFVQAAHAHVSILRPFEPSMYNRLLQGTKAIVTVGGWTGSQYFSSAFGSADNRTAFVKTMTNLVSQYSIDGLDFE
jgi:chitinase